MTALLGAESGPYFAVTVVVFGGAAFLTGRALAQNWRPAWQILPAAALLAAGDRFLLHTLYGAEFAGFVGFSIAVAILAAIAAIAYYFIRAHRMVQQYPWLYERRGPFGWHQK